jgi:hypothetical protein
VPLSLIFVAKAEDQNPLWRNILPKIGAEEALASTEPAAFSFRAVLEASSSRSPLQSRFLAQLAPEARE